MSAKLDLATASQNQVAARLITVKTELEHIKAKAGDRTEADLATANELIAELAQLRDKGDRFAKAANLDIPIRETHDYLTKPVVGLAHGNGQQGKKDDKGVEIGDHIEGVQAKAQPWAIFGDRGGFYSAVAELAKPNPAEDVRKKIHDWKTMQVKTTPAGLYEGSDPDGGVLVPAETSSEIYTRTLDLENLWPNVDTMTVVGNTMTYPKLNDKSRADGARDGGVEAYWEGEGDTYTGSKPQFGLDSLRLKKLACLIYATDEVLADARALGSFLSSRAAAAITFKLNFGLVRGNGVGMPLGVINSGGTISVAKETGQPAATIFTENIEKMWMRGRAAFRSNMEWWINQDIEAALQAMVLPIGVGGVPTYLPPGGVSSSPYATLKGRPVKVIEQCSTLGTVGDIILAAPKAIRAISKGGVDEAISMHVRFLTGEQTFRFTFRADAAPKESEPLTPYQGTMTTSPFVTLATRA